MPKKVTSAKKAPQKPKTAPAKKAPAAKPAVDAEAKRKAQQAQDAKLRAEVVKRCVKGDETVGSVAKVLKITPGKAAFLIMQHRVENGEVPSISAKSDSALLNAIATARAKGDEFSSWGWLAARSGRSEGWIKSGLADAGKYTPKSENIATLRASKKPAAAKKSGVKVTAGKKGGKKRTRGNA